MKRISQMSLSLPTVASRRSDGAIAPGVDLSVSLINSAGRRREAKIAFVGDATRFSVCLAGGGGRFSANQIMKAFDGTRLSLVDNGEILGEIEVRIPRGEDLVRLVSTSGVVQAPAKC